MADRDDAPHDEHIKAWRRYGEPIGLLEAVYRGLQCR